MTELICSLCPRGCRLAVDEAALVVSGNGCEKGAVFGAGEITNPRRTVTGTVRLINGALPRCPVRTDRPIPKNRLRDAMAVLRGVTLRAPVHIGQIAVKDLLGTGADVIVTREFD